MPLIKLEPETWLNLLSVSQFIIVIITTFITATKKLTDERKSFLNKFTKIGKFVGLLLILSLFLFIQQIRITNENQKQVEKKQIERDSIAETKSDKRNDSTITTITRALAEYKLNYDGKANKIIKSITEKEEVPLVGFSSDGIRFIKIDSIHEGDKKLFNYNFQILLQCTNADAYHLKVNFKCICTDYFGNYFCEKINSKDLSTNIIISKNNSYSIKHEFSSKDRYKAVYYIIEGTYTNYNSTKSYNINDLNGYELPTRLYGFPTDREKGNINLFLKSKRYNCY